jgi:hypothetical protein
MRKIYAISEIVKRDLEIINPRGFIKKFPTKYNVNIEYMQHVH